MKVSTNLPAEQAFSYLSENQKTESSSSWIHNTLNIVGLLSIAIFSIAVPFPKNWVSAHICSSPIFLFSLHALLLVVKAFFTTEAILYLSHRYVEHLGYLTRHWGIARQNQQFHWTHHMIIYPINHQYQRGNKYIEVDRYGIPWHWLFPMSSVLILTLFFMGFHLDTLVFLLIMVAYTKFVDIMHSLFHLKTHFLSKNRYYQWLDWIHLLHHFDQQKNFTITVPFMDILFGTYLSPQKRFSHIKTWLHEHDLNASDFINWHYLLTEATPIEYAVKIAAVQKYKGVAKKAINMTVLLKRFKVDDPFYQESQELLNRLTIFLQHAETTTHPLPNP